MNKPPDEGYRSSSTKLWMRFIALVGVVLIGAFGVYLIWSSYAGGITAERRALAEARVLNTEINAAWDYINSIQDTINYTEGAFDFKGVYCSVAGKNIALRFTAASDYSIRYIRENPRSGTDVPDSFEMRALRQFEEGVADEYYAMVDYEGQASFRYVSVLRLEANCLECHGNPAGEKDITGFLKEGMSLGDVGGAVSIVMPMTLIEAEARDDFLTTLIFFIGLLISVTAVIGWGLNRWVTRPIIDENEQLYDETEAQSTLLSVVSHELKTPLSSIMAYNELLKRKSLDRPEDELLLMDEIEANSKILLSTISNLLETAKREVNGIALNPEATDVYDVANTVMSSVEPLAARKKVNIVLSTDDNIPIIMIDKDSLRHIALNLLSNALRFTDEGGTIELSLKYGEGKLIVGVSDDGVGIPEDSLPFVFDRFTSMEGSEKTSEGGTGLGLFIVKGLAEAMGGTVGVESTAGVGTTFTVVLDVTTCQESE